MERIGQSVIQCIDIRGYSWSDRSGSAATYQGHGYSQLTTLHYTQITSHRSICHSIDYYAMPKVKESIDQYSVHTRILHQEYSNP